MSAHRRSVFALVSLLSTETFGHKLSTEACRWQSMLLLNSCMRKLNILTNTRDQFHRQWRRLCLTENNNVSGLSFHGFCCASQAWKWVGKVCDFLGKLSKLVDLSTYVHCSVSLCLPVFERITGHFQLADVKVLQFPRMWKKRLLSRLERNVEIRKELRNLTAFKNCKKFMEFFLFPMLGFRFLKQALLSSA